MLKLKHSHHLDFSHLILTPTQMELSPVSADDDELTQAIIEDPQEHDNNWELDERPDMGELTEFWTEVENDVQNDPEWFRFSED